MSGIEFRRVDTEVDAARVPPGWIAYRSTKTVFAMLAEQVDQMMLTEGLSRSEAQEEQLRRAMASLDAVAVQPR